MESREKTLKRAKERIEKLEHFDGMIGLNDTQRIDLEILKELVALVEKPQWVPITDELPKDDKYIFLSFDNFSLPEIGRYESDDEGGAFYVGDDDKSCSSYGLFVNAWMPVFENYKGGNRNDSRRSYRCNYNRTMHRL